MRSDFEELRARVKKKNERPGLVVVVDDLECLLCLSLFSGW
jgi:hypothetical protein